MSQGPERGRALGAFDYVVVGSGFGGSVSALRLTEKGYRVLVLEKGRRFRPRDFPRTNWNLPKWLWAPSVGFRGPFRMRFLPHVTALVGVGVGGGSLVYANTLPMPSREFFEQGAWTALVDDWEAELAPHYRTAQRMLGAEENRELAQGDRVLGEIARAMGREEHFGPTQVGVFQGEPGVTVEDPYFDGKGPTRTGCVRCGGCMIGCRHNAKNTLDKNYLYLAEALGLRILADTEVTAVRPHPDGGYRVEALWGRGFRRRKLMVQTGGVVFAGGAMGTTELLLRMKEDPRGLPRLSDRLGCGVRTNSESLIGVATARSGYDLSKGVAIGSILHTDRHTHVEPVRYPRGSGFFRLMSLPHAPGETLLGRLREMARRFLARPLDHLSAYCVSDFARSTQIMLGMQTVEGTLRFVLGRGVTTGGRRGLQTALDEGARPSTFIPAATEVADRFAEMIGGVPISMGTELLLGTPTTAHILGGVPMGRDPGEGAIDADHRLFGYENLYAIDGSALSGNPGVNPSLTITALAERALHRIPPKR